MSLITHVTIVAKSIAEADAEFLKTVSVAGDERQQAFGELPDPYKNVAGGTKSYVDDVFLAALNYVTPTDLLEHLGSHTWSTYTKAVIVVDYENFFREAIWRIESGRVYVVVTGEEW